MKRTWTSESTLGLQSGIVAGCLQAGRSGKRPGVRSVKPQGKRPPSADQRHRSSPGRGSPACGPHASHLRGAGRRACPAARGALPLLTFERRRARALRTSPARGSRCGLQMPACRAHWPGRAGGGRRGSRPGRGAAPSPAHHEVRREAPASAAGKPRTFPAGLQGPQGAQTWATWAYLQKGL